MTTTNLSEFGNREKEMAGKLLIAYSDNKTTKIFDEYFDDDEVTVMMNRNSGNVFLTNSDFQVGMMSDGEIDLFFSCPECGNEGFIDELTTESECCVEYPNNYKEGE